MEISRRHLLFAPWLSQLSAIELNKIKLGVTNDEVSEDPLVTVKFLRDYGLRYSEIRNVWGKYNTAQPIEKIRELRTIFDEHGIQTSVLATGFFKVPLPPNADALDKQWALLDAAMERAALLGTKRIRTFGFTYRDGEKPEAAVYPRIYELLTEAAKRARVKGLQLALENVGQSYIWSSTEAAAMLKAVKDDALGLTWDPNNAAQSGEKPFPDGFKRLDPARILNVHLRDFRRNGTGGADWCAVGEGEMDNLGQIRALLKHGYRDVFTLETHYKSPLGKEHASRTSMTALVKVFAKA